MSDVGSVSDRGFGVDVDMPICDETLSIIISEDDYGNVVS